MDTGHVRRWRRRGKEINIRQAWSARLELWQIWWIWHLRESLPIHKQKNDPAFRLRNAKRCSCHEIVHLSSWRMVFFAWLIVETDESLLIEQQLFDLDVPRNISRPWYHAKRCFLGIDARLCDVDDCFGSSVLKIVAQRPSLINGANLMWRIFSLDDQQRFASNIAAFAFRTERTQRIHQLYFWTLSDFYNSGSLNI